MPDEINGRLICCGKTGPKWDSSYRTDSVRVLKMDKVNYLLIKLIMCDDYEWSLMNDVVSWRWHDTARRGAGSVVDIKRRDYSWQVRQHNVTVPPAQQVSRLLCRDVRHFGNLIITLILDYWVCGGYLCEIDFFYAEIKFLQCRKFVSYM